MRHQDAIRPVGFGILQQRQQTAALHLSPHRIAEFRAGDLCQGREDVDVRGERGAIDAALERGGPTPERRHTRPAFIGRDFAAAHAGVVNLHAECAAVIGQENNERVLLDPPLFELLQQRAEVLVKVLDHPEESGGIVRDFAFVALEILVR